MNNVILLATYWNEIEWIEASLAQIDKIDPREVIICDGCFDPQYPNQSTDGTREIIKTYAAARDNTRMISALRLSRLQHYFSWFKPLPHESSRFFTLAKLRTAKGFHRWNLYRLNQMATFNHMIRLSRHFRPNLWFMTNDCDQFYSDAMLEAFGGLLDEDTPYNMLTGKEYTFFEDFDHYTAGYEKRDYNNMPHRIFRDTRFIPTRHPARVVNRRYRIYTEFEAKRYVGITYHYHIKSPERLKAGYSLGDREPPETSRTETKPYHGKHPIIIQEFFLSCPLWFPLS